MQRPDVLVDESERLDTLSSLGILDTPPEEAFDRIVRHASRVLDVPIAVLSLVDADRQWFKARVGLGLSGTPRDASFCGHAIQSDAPLIVPDAASDARFEHSPLVTGAEQIRFYAGQPLVIAGRRVGTLCVMDRRPRSFDGECQETLLGLAQWAEAELVRRTAVHRPHASAVQEQRLDALVAALPDIAMRVDARGVVRGFHGGGAADASRPSRIRVGISLAELMPPDLVPEHMGLVARTIATGARQQRRVAVEERGERRHYDARFSRVHEDEVLIVVRDVTEEARTADSLRRSEALFRQTSELTATGSWEFDVASGQTRWSGQMYRNLEVDPACPADDAARFQARVEPEHREGVEEMWARALATGATQCVEVPVRTEGGRRRWMRFVGAAQREGGVVVRLYGACQDITERMEAAVERERREDQLRVLGDGLPDAGLFQIETGGGAPRFTYLSRSMATLLGIGEGDPSDLLERLGGPDRRRLLLLGTAAQGQVSPMEAEVRFDAPSGPRWLYFRCVPRLTPDGRCCWDGLVFDQTRRREAERNDRLRHQRLTAVLQTAGDATFVVTPNATVELANPAAEQMFGAQASALDGVAITELLPAWSGPDGPRDLVGLRRTGGTFPVTCTTTALDGDDRRVVVVRDQSERRRLEHRLAERGALLSEMQRLVSMGAWKFDLRTGTLALDEEFHRIHGTRADSETLQTDIRQCVHPDEHVVYDSLMIDAMALRRPIEKEFRVLHPDGVRHVVARGEIVFGDDDMPVAFRGFSQDITERRRMEEEQRRLVGERERLAQILDATPDIVSMADADGRVLYVNRAGRKLAKLAPDADVEALGLTVQACHPDWAWRHLEGVAIPAARRDGVWVGESVFKAGAGGEIPVAQTILAHRSPDGEVERLSTIARDIRGQKRTERALAAARLRAEEANRAKSAFLANMSHELRTPLNAIIGFSDLLAQLAFGPLNTRQADYVGHIVAGGRHLLSLVDDILDLSKVEAGRLTLDLVETSVGPLLSAVCASMQPVAQRGGLALEVQVVPDLPSMRIDPKRVRQILLNLVSNACKFTPHGGRVVLEASADPQEMTLRVTDTGIGIGQENLRRVFDEFEQIVSPGGRRVDGTGLGLALSRRLAELHGGRLDVESEIGKGSSFSLRLPIGSPAPPPATHALLVGHDPAVAARLGEQLEQAGLHVDTAPSVDAACARLERRAPDVLVLDVDLRARLDAGAALVREAARLSVPVVYLGGVGSTSEDDQGPPPRWQTVARLRASGVALPSLAGLRIWVFDVDQSLAALENLLRDGGATARRGSSLSGAVAFDADLIVHGFLPEESELPAHATLPTLFVPAGLSVQEVAALVYGAMAGGATLV